MNIPQSIENMLKTLHDAGYAAYLVGGCVRDALLGLVPHDYDIATNAVPDEIIGLFGKKHCTFYGRAFGTVGVRQGGFAEITTFRTEGDYRDCRHPGVVKFADHVEEDLARRDFTCNAIAYDPRTGLLDPYHGADDLKNGILRAVGVPTARFREDALRIMRGMRFVAKFGMKPDMLTDAAMHACAYRLRQISAERVMTELCGMLTGKYIKEVLLAYPDVLGEWIPEILPCIAFSQHSTHHDHTVWEHTARAVGDAEPLLPVRMALLLHDIAKPCCYRQDESGGHFKQHADRGAEMADSILHRLRCDNHLREQVVSLIRLHRGIPQDMPEVRRITGQIGTEGYRMLLMVLKADGGAKRSGVPESQEGIIHAEKLFQECRDRKLCCTIRELAVNGHDVAALGLQGKAIGAALHSVLEEVICDRLPNEKEAILRYLMRK